MFPYKEQYDWSEVRNPMTQEEAREWVAALRSGKYEQGNGYLKDNGGKFCCLGVEQDIHNVSCESLVVLKDWNPDEYVRLPQDLQGDLAGMNDDGRTFEEIAKEIERGFGLVHTS